MISDNKVNKNLCIVIATLGGKSLFETLTAINKSSILPKKILVCSPRMEAKLNIPKENNQNIFFLLTKSWGQVAQRAEGLSRVDASIVMQMDDDVFVYENTIEQLLAVLNSCGKGHAVSPIFCDSNTRELLTKYTKGFRGLVRNLIDFIIFGSFWGIAKMGSISQSGTPFYYDFNYLNKNLMLSSWLPGGMVICHKEDLLIKDYYPFKGKAYFEDVIHSILWRNMGIKLIVANVIVPTVVSKEKNTLKELVKEYRAKKYVVALLKHGMFHCRLSFFFSLIMYTAKQITLQIFGSKK